MEILLNISRSPIDKIRFELLKHLILLGEGHKDEQMVLLNSILESPYSDWRTFYRSLYLATSLVGESTDFNSKDLE